MLTENRTNDKEDKYNLESHLKLSYPGPTVRLGYNSSVDSLCSLNICFAHLHTFKLTLINTWSILWIFGRNEAPTTADDIPAASRDHVLPRIWRRLRSHKLMDTWCCWFDNGHLSCWPPDPGHAEDTGEEVIRGPGVIRWPGAGGGLWHRVC